MSDSDLGRSWRPSGLSHVLGSRVSKIFVSMVCSVFFECFLEVLLRCERLPFASQSVRLELVRHGADVCQTLVKMQLLFLVRLISCSISRVFEWFKSQTLSSFNA